MKQLKRTIDSFLADWK